MNGIINTGHLPTDESNAKELIRVVNKMRGDAQQALKRIDKNEIEKEKNEIQKKVNELVTIKAVEPLRTSEINDQLIQLNKELESLKLNNETTATSIREYIFNNYKEELGKVYKEAEKEYRENLKAWSEFDKKLKYELDKVSEQKRHFLYDADFCLNVRWLDDYLRFIDKNANQIEW